jgi:hypothetical protein
LIFDKLPVILIIIALPTSVEMSEEANNAIELPRI